MCLMIEVELPGVNPKKAGDMTKEAARRSLLTLWAERVPKKTEACRFRITAGPDECSCRFLAKDSENSGPSLSIEPEALPKITATLKFLAEKARDGVIFHSYYVSDERPPIRDVKLSMKDLVTIVGSGKLGNGTRYIAC